MEKKQAQKVENIFLVEKVEGKKKVKIKRVFLERV